MSDSETIRQALEQPWWWCRGIQEIWSDKPDDCGDPGSFYPHDGCGPVVVVDATTAAAYADWLDGPTDEEVEKGALGAMRHLMEVYDIPEDEPTWQESSDSQKAYARAVLEAVRPGDQT